jgi:sugar phosphate permease
MVTFIPLGVVTGCLLNGIAARLFSGARGAVLTLLSGAGICWIIIAFVRIPEPLMYWYYPLFFAAGFFTSGINLIYTTTRELNPAAIAGTALSFTNIGGFLMVSILQPLFGWILDCSKVPGAVPSTGIGYPYSGYRTVFILIAAIHCAAVAIYFFTHKRAGEALQQPVV